MRRIVLAAALLAGFLPVAQPEPPQLPRAAVAALEVKLDERLTKPSSEDPFELLGNTRGIYLEGYGVVFTSKVSLAVQPLVFPFRPELTKADVEVLHQKKLAKLPALRRLVREALADAAKALDTLPPDEQVVIGITLSYLSWENKTALPLQIVMGAARRSLLSKTGEDLTASIRTREY